MQEFRINRKNAYIPSLVNNQVFSDFAYPFEGKTQPAVYDINHSNFNKQVAHLIKLFKQAVKSLEPNNVQMYWSRLKDFRNQFIHSSEDRSKFNRYRKNRDTQYFLNVKQSLERINAHITRSIESEPEQALRYLKRVCNSLVVCAPGIQGHLEEILCDLSTMQNIRYWMAELRTTITESFADTHFRRHGFAPIIHVHVRQSFINIANENGLNLIKTSKNDPYLHLARLTHSDISKFIEHFNKYYSAAEVIKYIEQKMSQMVTSFQIKYNANATGWIEIGNLYSNITKDIINMINALEDNNDPSPDISKILELSENSAQLRLNPNFISNIKNIITESLISQGIVSPIDIPPTELTSSLNNTAYNPNAPLVEPVSLQYSVEADIIVNSHTSAPLILTRDNVAYDWVTGTISHNTIIMPFNQHLEESTGQVVSLNQHLGEPTGQVLSFNHSRLEDYNLSLEDNRSFSIHNQTISASLNQHPGELMGQIVSLNQHPGELMGHVSVNQSILEDYNLSLEDDRPFSIHNQTIISASWNQHPGEPTGQLIIQGQPLLEQSNIFLDDDIARYTPLIEPQNHSQREPDAREEQAHQSEREARERQSALEALEAQEERERQNQLESQRELKKQRTDNVRRMKLHRKWSLITIGVLSIILSAVCGPALGICGPLAGGIFGLFSSFLICSVNTRIKTLAKQKYEISSMVSADEKTAFQEGMEAQKRYRPYIKSFFIYNNYRHLPAYLAGMEATLDETKELENRVLRQCTR